MKLFSQNSIKYFWLNVKINFKKFVIPQILVADRDVVHFN